MKVTMQDSFMSASRAHHLPASVREMARLNGGRDMLFLVILVYALAKGSEALADPVSSEREFRPVVAGSRPLPLGVSPGFILPRDMLDRVPAPREFSATEFSPRRRSSLGSASANAAAIAEPPTLSTTNVWQRLADYRAQDRVRLVTLWESSGSTLSLQAGKGGSPSLQWTSRAMNRGGATRGLLDRVIAASLGAAVGQSRNSSRAAQPASPAKQLSLLPGLPKAP
jgi:hypothetical protein